MALSTQSAPSFSPLSSFSSTTPSTYDVFLSFRGEDTRYGFIDHLHAALKQRGITIFKDDEELEQGNSISESLSKAIKESQYAIVIISKTFAFSKWCLKELSMIMECKKIRLEVLPVFYHVDPSDVRRQKGIFAQAFHKHSEDLKEDENQRKAWRAALTEIANISGWHVHNNRPEATIVKEITRKILCGLRSNPSKVFEDFVGIESQVKKLISLLHLEMDDVRCIGIHGMGGIGKTTLAKALYDIVCCDFDASSFICCNNNNRSCNIDELQEQIIHDILGENNMKIWNFYCGTDVLRKRLSNKRVFIVLDDVNCQQLQVLAGKPSLFGKGSRIILTSRDCQFWRRIVSEIYEVQPLEHKDALQLFCQNAFNRSYPEESFVELTINIIRLVAGLPLALEVVGSFLFGMEIGVWNSALHALKVCPRNEILDKLEISYGSLEDVEKEMFLDIACFFNGIANTKILPIFESLNYHPNFHFEVLKNKSLIKISQKGIIWMHDLLRTMGQRIIYQLSPMEPGNRSRLWCSKDIVRVLRNNSGTDVVEGIVFNYYDSNVQELSFEAFSKMRNLKVLIIGEDNYMLGKVKWFGDPLRLILSNELRVMEWLDFPMNSLPSSFQPENLVKLYIRQSMIEVLWLGRKAFDSLKYIDLRSSYNLREIPDLSGVPNLEVLNCEFCSCLRKIHPSIGALKKLLQLNLQYCKHLERLPKKICWESLESLDLSYCVRLENFPENVCTMTSLSLLKLPGTRIRIPSLWMESLSSLTMLDISGYIEQIRHFEVSSHHFCQFIDLHYNSISCLHWLSNLSFLTSLDLCGRNLLDEDIPNDISYLSLLQVLNLSSNLFTKIPQGICQLSHLRTLCLCDCKYLQSLSMSLPLGVSSLSYPSDIYLSFRKCNLLNEAIPSDFGCLSWASFLDLSGNKFVTLPHRFCQLSKLKHLVMEDCSQLRALPKLPLSLRYLRITNCPFIEMGYSQTEVRTLQLCNNIWFSVANSTSDTSTPYKIIQVNPQYLLGSQRPYKFDDEGDIFAWGPMLGLEIPRWFNRTSTNPLGKIQFQVDVDLEYKNMGLALFVVYQVHEHENSNGSNSGHSHPVLPEFACRFQSSNICPEVTLVFPVPEVPFAGPNGFWAYIPDDLLYYKGWCLDKPCDLEASIETSSLNVEVRDCGICLVTKQNISEFYDVLDSISPRGLKLKNYEDFEFKLLVGDNDSSKSWVSNVEKKSSDCDDVGYVRYIIRLFKRFFKFW